MKTRVVVRYPNITTIHRIGKQEKRTFTLGKVMPGWRHGVTKDGGVIVEDDAGWVHVVSRAIVFSK